MIDTFKKFVAEAVALIVYTSIVAAVAMIIYVLHYSHASSPPGFHCWHEINSSQPMGIEKVCAANS